jgi:hypothetical protein
LNDTHAAVLVVVENLRRQRLVVAHGRSHLLQRALLLCCAVW